MDTGKLYIPNLNAIPLFLKEQLPSDNYSIKYEQGDFTCIQLFCVDSEFEVKITLHDISGKLISTIPINTSIVNTDTYKIRFYTALIRFSQVNEGGYYIEVSAKNNIGEICRYNSPCIDVRQHHRKTFLIEYFNSENANNVLFNNGTSFALRIEGGFLPKSYVPKSQETIYQNQKIEFKILESIPYNSNILTAGGERGIPDWVFDKLHRALSCDNTIIENVAMTKIEGATWSSTEEDGYDFRTWKIELVQANDNISRPVLCIETAIYTCDYEWLDTDAVCQLTEEINETIEFSDYVCQDIAEWSSITISGGATASGIWWKDVAYGYDTYGNGRFVAVISNVNAATTSMLAYSDDGISWTAATMPSSSNWRSVAYGAGKYVAISEGYDTAAYSYSAFGTWLEMTMPEAIRWSAITYGNGKFVAVAYEKNIAAYSIDGIKWETTTMPFAGKWIDVAYGNGRFVAIATNSFTFANSADGISWSSSSLPSGAGGYGWRSAAYGESYFIAVADNLGKYVYSTDGTVWTVGDFPSDSDWNAIAYGGGRFVVVGREGKSLYSLDGFNWVEVSIPVAIYEAVAYGGGIFVAVAAQTEGQYGQGAVFQLSAETIAGKAYATLSTYSRYYEGALEEEITKSMLTDVQPALEEVEYQTLSETEVGERVEAVVELFDCQTAPEYLNEAVIDEETCVPPVYEFFFPLFVVTGGTDWQEHTIMSDETFWDTIVSTKNGGSTAYTVFSNPSWAQVLIDGNTATITSNNTGAYREGTIVYRQTETGAEIVSEIKQYGAFGAEVFTLGIGKFSSITESPYYPGFPPADYGISYDFAVEIGGVTISSGTRTLAEGNSSTSSLIDIQISDSWSYAKTIQIFLTNPQVNYSGGTATVSFGDSSTYSVQQQGYITQIEVTSTSVYIEVEDKGGMTCVGKFTIRPVVVLMPAEATFAMEWNDRVCQLSKEWWVREGDWDNNDFIAVAYGGGRFVAITLYQNTVCYSTDGVNWTIGQFPVGTHYACAVAYGDGTFVTTGAYSGGNSSTMYSTNGGASWTETSSISSCNWKAIAYGGGIFVAVGQDKIAYSSDGISWADSPSTIAGSWRSVAFGNGKFVAVGEGSTIAYSADGVSWTESPSTVTTDLMSIVYGNGKFVAVGKNNDAMYSTDGVNWTATKLPSMPSSWRSVAFGGWIFVAIGANSVFYSAAYSLDGIRWFDLPLPETTVDLYSIAYGDGKFVGVGYYHNMGDSNVATLVIECTGKALAETLTLIISENGVESERVGYSILSAFDTYPAIVESDYIDMTDTDIETRAAALIEHVAETEEIEEYEEINDVIEYDIAMCPISMKWTAATMPSSKYWFQIAYGGGMFVAVASSSDTAAYSTDGINWTATTMPSSDYWSAIAYGGGIFVAVAIESNAAYSTDGINWTAATMPSSVRWREIAYGGGIFVALAPDTNTAAYSTDGINWTATTMPSSGTWQAIAYGGGIFVAVESVSNKAAYSTDGINWTATTMPSLAPWRSIAYGGGIFFALAYYSDAAAYSTDGINWTAATMPSSEAWRSIAYGGGIFVALVYNSNTAAYSTDGINWTATTMPSSGTWQSIAYGGGMFVALAYYSDAAAYLIM